MTQPLPEMTTILDFVPADPDDPYYVELGHAHDVMSNLHAAIPYKRAIALRAHFEGCSGNEIATRAGYSKPPRIAHWLKDKFSIEAKYYLQLHRIHAIRSGPTLEQRKHLLWQIARDNAQEAPSHAIKAVDTLNRMDGLYQVQEDRQTGLAVLRFDPDKIDFTQMQTVIAALDHHNTQQPKQVEGKRVD